MTQKCRDEKSIYAKIVLNLTNCAIWIRLQYNYHVNGLKVVILHTKFFNYFAYKIFIFSIQKILLKK